MSRRLVCIEEKIGMPQSNDGLSDKSGSLVDPAEPRCDRIRLVSSAGVLVISRNSIVVYA